MTTNDDALIARARELRAKVADWRGWYLRGISIERDSLDSPVSIDALMQFYKDAETLVPALADALASANARTAELEAALRETTELLSFTSRNVPRMASDEYRMTLARRIVANRALLDAGDGGAGA